MKSWMRNTSGLFLLGLLLSFLGTAGRICCEADAAWSSEGDSITIPLHHVHNAEDCYDEVWVPCGGYWTSYYEPYYEATCYICSNFGSDEVVNGVRLGSIHNQYHTDPKSGTHDGEYARSCSCNVNVLGNLQITEKTSGEVAYLEAEILEQSPMLQDFQIVFTNGEYFAGCLDASGNTCKNQSTQVSISENGVYEGYVTWYDSLGKCQSQQAFTYTVTSLPITLDFYSQEQLLFSKSLLYGKELPNLGELEVQRTGYVFQGFYLGNMLVYDADLNAAAGFPTDIEQMKVGLEARWSPKKYTLHLVNEKSEILATRSVTFGEPYDEIKEVAELWKASGILGFYAGANRIYDAEGNPVSTKWLWDLEDTEIKPGFPSPVEDEHNDSREEPQEERAPRTLAADAQTTFPIAELPDAAFTEFAVSEIEEIDGGNEEINEMNEMAEASVREPFQTEPQAAEEDAGETLGNGKLEDPLEEALEENAEIYADLEGDRIEAPEASRQEPDSSLEEGHREKGRSKVAAFVKVAIFTLGSVISLLVLAYSLFLLRFSAVLYSVHNKKKKRIAYLFPKKESCGIELTLTQAMLSESEWGEYMVQLPFLLHKKYKNEPVVLHLPAGKQKICSGRRILFDL